MAPWYLYWQWSRHRMYDGQVLKLRDSCHPGLLAPGPVIALHQVLPLWPIQVWCSASHTPEGITDQYRCEINNAIWVGSTLQRLLLADIDEKEIDFKTFLGFILSHFGYPVWPLGNNQKRQKTKRRSTHIMKGHSDRFRGEFQHQIRYCRKDE